MCVHVHMYVCVDVHTIIFLSHIPIHKMEDDSLLDDPTILVRETSPQTTVTPGSFSKRLENHLGLNRIKRSETIQTNNKTSAVAIRYGPGNKTHHKSLPKKTKIRLCT